jgi:cytochrome c-type biogenesis protein CcmF
VLMAPVVLLMAFGPYVRWQQDQVSRVWGLLKWLALAAVLAALGALVLSGFDLPAYAVVGLAGAFWVFFATLKYLRERAVKAGGFTNLPRGVWGMTLAHLGVGVFVVGVSLVENTLLMKDLAMGPKDEHTLGPYRFVFDGTTHRAGPNFEADRGTFQVYRNDERIATLHPEKRAYRSQRGQVMTESAIDRGLTRDVYIALGEPLDEAGTRWGVRLYIKPYIRWIWAGALLMMLGGFVAASDRRYRTAKVRDASPAGAVGAA